MKRLFLSLLAASIFLSSPAFAQRFGQNKVQYKKQNWNYIQSEHFDLYFYEGGDYIAEMSAAIAESSYTHLSKSFNYRLRDRISLILYNSHNDFEETNLSFQIQNEATGGFTEFLKNRVVLPYEGSLEQLRHVIHHELTHAVMLQFYFGTGPGAIINGISRLQLPLWFVEGAAQYESLYGIDTNVDQQVRDAVLNNYLPPVQALQFMAYSAGPMVFYYIEQRYGKGKVTELYSAIKSTRSVNRGFQKALGQDLEGFYKKWSKWLRENYWPEIKLHDEPEEISTQLTDHEKSKNFINNAPALSPKGDMLAFLSDKAGFFDIYLMSTLDKRIVGKLVSGQRTAAVEELKWLRPGISWSPDSKKIVFAAKASRSDVLHIVEVRKSKIRRTLRFDQLDGVFSPTWSPNGDDIAFVGMLEGRSDLYNYNLKTDELTHITNDQFTDLEPEWSPDGKKIAFTSDRGNYLDPNTPKIDIISHHFSNTDIYIYDLASRKITRVTDALSLEKSPAWFQGADTLMYVSDRNGIFNIYTQDLRTGDETFLTNLISGANQLSIARNTKRLAFASFYKGGYDIFLWKNPMESIETPDTLRLTEFIQARQPYSREAEDEESVFVASNNEGNETGRPYRHFVFGKGFAEGRFNAQSDTSIALSPDDFKTATGGFKKRKYTPKFSVDYAGAIGGYDTFFGVQGATQLILSDLLGNHQIAVSANIIRSIANSDLSLAYANLARRMDFSVAAYHTANFFQAQRNITFADGSVRRLATIERFRNYGVGGSVSYPFNRYKRLDFGVNWFNIREDELLYNEPSLTTSTMLFTAGYNVDNAVWAYTGPFDGKRNSIGVTLSPKLGNNGLGFVTLNADFRKYIMLNREFSIAFRLAGGASFGPNPTRFLVGGVTSWINYEFADSINFEDIRDFYFSQFVTPVRGANYYEKTGSRYLVANAEFKFPLIQYLIARFPLPLFFSNIRGAAFFDVASAWNGSDFDPISRRNGKLFFEDLVGGVGWGLRTPFLIGLLRIDQAWRIDQAGIGGSRWYFSFGVDF